MGAVGLGGAWLGAQATRRRERWGHRREVYQPILLSLMDLYIHSRHRLRLEEESDSADPKSQVRLNETIERAAAAMTEVQRVSAIAVVLGDDVHAALDELGTQWLNATHENTGGGEAAARYAAVQKQAHCRGYCKTTLEVMSKTPGAACQTPGGGSSPSLTSEPAILWSTWSRRCGPPRATMTTTGWTEE